MGLVEAFVLVLKWAAVISPVLFLTLVVLFVLSRILRDFYVEPEFQDTFTTAFLYTLIFSVTGITTMTISIFAYTSFF